ncbi:PDE9A [Symbiodinium pilosum]|uniref:Phosphodiesterase n=1 Tax=Symbiodinium pilosum TaxID=2952 RepID=A0A812V7P7_SYMPI|nr:PDE9A [Symbiodinium pilosum]
MTDAGETSGGHILPSRTKVPACLTCCTGEQLQDVRLERGPDEALAENFKSDQGLATDQPRLASGLEDEAQTAQALGLRMALVEVQQVCPIFQQEPDDDFPAQAEEPVSEDEWVPRPRASIVQAAPRKNRNSISTRSSPPPRGLIARKLGDRYDSRFINCTRKVVTSRAWDVASMLVVLCALFLTDIYGVAQAPENTSLDILLTGCFCFFLAELLANTLTMESYLNSFFFWMDIIGTASIIFDISIFLGRDVTQRERSTGQSVGSDNAVFARASRAAKQAARAGRMSRLLKLLRFLPFLQNKEQSGQQVANAVSNKLTVMLATRVAFLSVCIVILIPLFSTFMYPEAEDSMTTWATLLSGDVGAYFASPSTGAASWINEQLLQFTSFYVNLPYGPFGICVRASTSDGFDCSAGGSIPDLVFQPTFSEPQRQSSVFEVQSIYVILMFNLGEVKQYEALSNLCCMIVVLVVMFVGCLMMSSSVNSVVLKPLQRVVKVLREHCAEIMKMAFQIREKTDNDSKEFSRNAPTEADAEESELDLLQKVLTKIVNICEVVIPTRRRASNQEEFVFLVDYGAESRAAGHVAAPIMRLEVADQVEDTSAGVNEDMKQMLDNRLLNVFQVPPEQQRRLAFHLMANTRSCRRWVRRQALSEKLINFIAAIQSRYLSNPFHNFSHGLDVLSEARLYLHSIKSYTLLSEVTVFWFLIAALGHDVGHLGVNNQFLVETSHALALRYNDKSVLENLHCKLLFEVLSDAKTNVLEVLDKADYKLARSGMVEVILGTDMVRHNEDIKALSIVYAMHQEVFEAAAEDPSQLSQALQEDTKSRLKVLSSLLHTADVSNPMKPWAICEPLADLCLEEFFAQGDKEKELGIPVQMLNDRDKVNRPNSQVGFIEFVIAPLAEQLALIFPALAFLPANLSANTQHWAEIWKQTSSASAEELEKFDARISKVTGRFKAFNQRREVNTRQSISAQSEVST